MDSTTLTPEDVIQMPLAEFREHFGFIPIDALEKKHFAVTGHRPSDLVRDAITAGIIGDLSHDNVVMK